MKTFVFAFMFVCLSFNAFAQTNEPSTIYIARPKNMRYAKIKMELAVNGETIVLPNRSYIELSINTPDISIKTLNKREEKYSKAVQLTIDQGQYFLAYFSVKDIKGWPRDIVLIQPVCKECYEHRIIDCSAIKKSIN